MQNLDARADQFVNEVMTTKVNSDPFMDKVNAIHGLGNNEIRESSNVSNRFDN